MRRFALPLAVLTMAASTAVPAAFAGPAAAAESAGRPARAALAEPDPEPAKKRPTFAEIPLDDMDRWLLPALADPDRTLTVMVQMKGDPVSVLESTAREAGTAITSTQLAVTRARLTVAQEAIVDDIGRLGGSVQSRLQDAYNGIRVRIRASQVTKLADLPGVAAVRPIPLAYRDNTSSIPFLGVPTVWQNHGFTGKGIRVGIIDSGIDYYHANFGGSGDPADYAADDRTVIEPGTFPTVRVVDGIDMVGDAFDAGSSDPARNTPKPDPDPLDCSGHGSHVAGTAAGNGGDRAIHDRLALRSGGGDRGGQHRAVGPDAGGGLARGVPIQ